MKTLVLVPSRNRKLFSKIDEHYKKFKVEILDIDDIRELIKREFSDKLEVYESLNYDISKLNYFKFLFLSENEGILIESSLVDLSEDYSDGFTESLSFIKSSNNSNRGIFKKALEIIERRIDKVKEDDCGKRFHDRVFRDLLNDLPILEIQENRLDLILRDKFSKKMKKVLYGKQFKRTVIQDHLEKITVITPFYNLDREYFEQCVFSISNLGYKAIYINDGSDEEYSNIFRELVRDEENCIVMDRKENKKLELTILEALEHVETEFVTRLDSDDWFSKYHLIEEHFLEKDAIFLEKTKDSIYNVLLKGASCPTGSLFKKDVFKDMYSDSYISRELELYHHEDLWHLFNFFYAGYSFVYVKNTSVYKKHFRDCSMSSSKVITNKKTRFDTFLLWSVSKDNFWFYHETLKKLSPKNFC